MQTKTCTKCCQEKVFSEFYKKKNGKFGLNSWCKGCLKEYNRSRMKDYMVEYRKIPRVKEKISVYDKTRKRQPGYQEKKNKDNRKYSKTTKGRNRNRRYMEDYQQELRDGYIRQLLVRQSGRILSIDEITQHLITLKRQTIKLKRLIKQKKDD